MMEEETGCFVEDEEFVDSEFDFDYEFDAVRYFDFTRPESLEEEREAESWFEYASSYPPSPYIVKLNLKAGFFLEIASPSPKSQVSEDIGSSVNGSDIRIGPEVSVFCEDKEDEILRHRAKSTNRKFRPKSSTLMKPTASALAKQNQPREVHPTKFRRPQNKLSKIFEKNSTNSTMVDSHETKRQKLESGYLCKVALLKHHSPFVHKAPNKPGKLDHTRLKVTIPKEPDLETAHRAQRHRPKCNTGEHTQSDVRSYKAHPLNRKILEAPSLPIPKKSMPQSPEFQEFHLKTAERAMKHISYNMVNMRSRTQSAIAFASQRSNCVDHFLEDRFKAGQKLNSQSLDKKELKFPGDKRLVNDLPIDLFNKLSLTTGSQPNAGSQPKSPMTAKGSKENAPTVLQNEFGKIDRTKENLRRFGGNLSLCAVDHKLQTIGSCLNISR